jgi:hypothetical protein
MTEAIASPGDDSADDSAAEAAEITVDAPEVEPEGDALDAAGRKLSDEAAKWRVQARAEETNRLIAEAKLAGVQTREVNRLLATKLQMPDDFWIASDVKLEDLLGDEGEVDADKVAEAADAVLQNRPHWAARLKPVGAPSAAVTGDGKYNVKGTGDKVDWSDVLRGKSAG